jgi:hypothetical protein
MMENPSKREFTANKIVKQTQSIMLFQLPLEFHEICTTTERILSFENRNI